MCGVRACECRTSMEAKNQHPQISIRRIMLWTFFVAIFSTVFSSLPTDAKSFWPGAAVVLVVVALDGLCPSKRRCAGMLALSFFACGLAYAVAACFFGIVVHPSPALIQQSRTLLEAIALAFAIVFQYAGTIAICTVVSSLIALHRLRSNSHSKWLLLLNVPGILLTGWLCFVILADLLTGS
jgi:hypothetical protein